MSASALVSADLLTGEPIIYGWDPEQSVLEGVLASMAIPPWFAPIETDDRYIIDGGALSNLPIEAALRLGATEIIALDLHDRDATFDTKGMLDPLLTNLAYAITQRQLGLEMELATAHHVSVKYVNLKSSPAVQLWDFKSHRDLFKIGYETMKNEMSGWSQNNHPASSFLRLLTKKIPSWFSA